MVIVDIWHVSKRQWTHIVQIVEKDIVKFYTDGVLVYEKANPPKGNKNNRHGLRKNT